jgi:hypothetical protein
VKRQRRGNGDGKANTSRLMRSSVEGVFVQFTSVQGAVLGVFSPDLRR